jgi:hypothetical protein
MLHQLRKHELTSVSSMTPRSYGSQGRRTRWNRWRRPSARRSVAWDSLNILFNNAGGSGKADGPVTTASLDEFWNKMRVDRPCNATVRSDRARRHRIRGDLLGVRRVPHDSLVTYSSWMQVHSPIEQKAPKGLIRVLTKSPASMSDLASYRLPSS